MVSLGQWNCPSATTTLATPKQLIRRSLELAKDGSVVTPIRSLYIHIPFCSHKCHYCDFYSIVDTQDRQEAFARRLERELLALSPLSRGAPLRTIFVGGGTPSLMRVDLWEGVLETLARYFDLDLMNAGMTGRDDLENLGEFTVECNPETVTPELLDTLRSGGVTRISMGAQSFDAAHLKTLERRHDPANVARSIELVRASGISRYSIDLIFGVPGQTLDDWARDLDRAIGLGTRHVSCYNLTYEPHTAMTARLARGEFTKADEDVEVDMYALTLSKLRAAGFERYEVSNYAKPGQECRHNMAYWQQAEWLAAGPSASAHLFGHRWKNTPRLDDYLRGEDEGFAPIVDLETPDARAALRERIMTGIRLFEGIDPAAILAEVERACAKKTQTALRARISRCIASGWIKPSTDRWQLTDQGFLFADTVASELMACI